MPELPEVEVCRLGIKPHIDKQIIDDIVVRQRQLRWPIPAQISDAIGEAILALERRSKYLIIKVTSGSILIHLGMSGTIRVIDKALAPVKHDHVDIVLANGKALRLNDPRRFGAVLWLAGDQDEQGVLAKLGPEPLTDDFHADYLYEKSRNKALPVKTFIMNNPVVVGVGNIYANESLFLSGIRPTKKAGKLTKKQCQLLTKNIKEVLAAAIKQGGTTLKDFTQADGRPGYFKQSLYVYGRAGQACLTCETTLKEVRQANRSSVYCPQCQKP
ncbi:bifunctional DNA-formamidopyrimidine glycosylase/DNA-(apurinic or apyrimidinic site) lyase [Thalassotalea euphylliae]|uniref:Formamidopyrimidine-DNA glycosylase n=1 Tax=Thalassotalea euphylliae TaxID=1655234 RepID=A0A3E0TKU8_9GAMM|nr:bifunctional DNA-formamidopyrimidine glycosylase/DNA-(apurinic or apyrimidinic site) lyase [Thalassotalea euphylliae]REL25174.1 bifunctional DNA-formamidopyrimidine glycosylase/DNA-(apurinic or apyrimidinic site) lyase [Thalassotalea euphylliae]